jgi:hypothetical protein
MSYLKKPTIDLVKSILETQPQTRDSDDLLYITIVMQEKEKSPHVFKNLAWHIKNSLLTSYGSISRTRRLLQAEYPHLQGDNWLKNQKYAKEVRKEFANG